MRALLLALSVLVLAACGVTANGDASRENPGNSATSVDTTAMNKAALAGKTIVIDPGHNGHNYQAPKTINRQVDVLTQRKACDTTGTEDATGYTESAFTWDVSNRLAKILRERGATVKLTRKNNTGVGPCITKRAEIGNKAKADAAVSVHADGAPAADRGFHVIMPKKINGPVDPVVGASAKLGRAVRDAVKKGTDLVYSTYIGKKALNYRDDLGGLNLSTVPKIFLEAGNMRNAKEAAEFRDPAFRQKLALALADGLQNYLR